MNIFTQNININTIQKGRSIKLSKNNLQDLIIYSIIKSIIVGDSKYSPWDLWIEFLLASMTQTWLQDLVKEPSVPMIRGNHDYKLVSNSLRNWLRLCMPFTNYNIFNNFDEGNLAI